MLLTSHEPVQNLDGTSSVNINHPNVWIADTGATTHSTAHLEGAISIREASTVTNIMGVSGPPIQATHEVDIKATKEEPGIGLHTVVLTDVAYVPNGRYNLFSITKMMNKGWVVTGSIGNGIALQKGANRLTFQEKIQTPKGTLYAAIFNRTKTSGTKSAVHWLLPAADPT